MLKKIFIAALAAVMAGGPALAASKQEKAETLVAKAAETVAYFNEDEAFGALRDLADDAKAMVIIPRSLRGGFMLGASGGNAVMVARNEDGSWSQPTFFTIGSLSFGFQAGGEASEIVLAVMTQRGMEHLLSTTVKLGGDVSIAAGPVGAGAKAQTTDVLAFARSRGLYGGISLEGAILKSRHSWNEAYYGARVSPADIIYRQKAYNPYSAVLQNSVAALARGQRPAATNLAPVQPVYTGAGEQTPPQNAPQGTFEDDDAWGAPVKQEEPQ